MTIAPLMWGVWGVLAILSCVGYVYRAKLTRDEDDQIFLDDSFEHEKVAQAEIVAKVSKVEPVLSVLLWLTGIATVFLIGYYIWDIMQQFK